ncbi:MAG: hypothetical protein HYZ94_00610 [Candidatus Omnitrophica bacterium]|nr:hypothetical protein [Candidatus Omnitrophota bacterium]
MKSRWLSLPALIGFLAGPAWAETLEIVTYYPAPSATAQDLHVRSLTVGTGFLGKTPADGEALVFDRLGIGTNAPAGVLHAVGVDDTVSQVLFTPGADTADPGEPEMRVGIGTQAPGAALQVNGAPSGITAIFRASDTTPGNITVWQDSLAVTGARVDAELNFSRPNGQDAEQFGAGASADGDRSVALGFGATTSVADSTALGYRASADAVSGGTAIGASAVSGAQNALAVGSLASATGVNSVAVGRASAVSGSGVAVGAAANAGDGGYTVAVGPYANTTVGLDGVALGYSATATSTRAIAIGNSARATHQSVAIGVTAESTSNFQFVCGDQNNPIREVYFSEGVFDADPLSFTIYGTNGEGSNVPGGGVRIAGGRSTGVGAGGPIIFQTASAGGAGSGINPLADRMTIDSGGNVGIGAPPIARLHIDGLGGSPPRTLLVANNNVETTLSRFIDCVRGGADSEFIVFNNGEVRADGQMVAPAFNSGSADYAEYFYSDDVALQPGELVTVAGGAKVKRCGRGELPIGVISEKPGVLGIYTADGTDAEKEVDEYPKNPHWVKVGLMGQVPVKVSVSQGAVRAGDQLTAGEDGKAVKGESPRTLLLLALEDAETDGTVRVLIK